MSADVTTDDIPEAFRVIRDELTPEDLERLQRLHKVMEWSREHGILCTGRPGLLECPNPPFTIIVLHGHGFALPCIDCVDPLGRAIMAAGHATFMQQPLSDSKPENLKEFAIYRRKVNAEAGKFVIPDGRH